VEERSGRGDDEAVWSGGAVRASDGSGGGEEFRSGTSVGRSGGGDAERGGGDAERGGGDTERGGGEGDRGGASKSDASGGADVRRIGADKDGVVSFGGDDCGNCAASASGAWFEIGRGTWAIFKVTFIFNVAWRGGASPCETVFDPGAAVDTAGSILNVAPGLAIGRSRENESGLRAEPGSDLGGELGVVLKFDAKNAAISS